MQMMVMALAGVSVLAVWTKAPPGLLYIVMIAAVVFSFWVFARLVFLFPAAAIEHRVALDEAFRLSRGNIWRLLAALLLAELPLWAFHLVWQPVGMLGILAGLTGSLLSALVGQSLIFAGVAIFVTALSLAYSVLAPTPAEPAAADG